MAAEFDKTLWEDQNLSLEEQMRMQEEFEAKQKAEQAAREKERNSRPSLAELVAVDRMNTLTAELVDKVESLEKK